MQTSQHKRQNASLSTETMELCLESLGFTSAAKATVVVAARRGHEGHVVVTQPILPQVKAQGCDGRFKARNLRPEFC